MNMDISEVKNEINQEVIVYEKVLFGELITL